MTCRAMREATLAQKANAASVGSTRRSSGGRASSCTTGLPASHGRATGGSRGLTTVSSLSSSSALSSSAAAGAASIVKTKSKSSRPVSGHSRPVSGRRLQQLNATQAAQSAVSADDDDVVTDSGADHVVADSSPQSTTTAGNDAVVMSTAADAVAVASTDVETATSGTASAGDACQRAVVADSAPQQSRRRSGPSEARRVSLPAVGLRTRIPVASIAHPFGDAVRVQSLSGRQKKASSSSTTTRTNRINGVARPLSASTLRRAGRVTSTSGIATTPSTRNSSTSRALASE